MDILNTITDLMNSVSNLGEAAQKDAIRKKPLVRMKFYELVNDYQSAAGTRPLNDFFEWYIHQLDRRMDVAPQWLKSWYKITGAKNEKTLRAFLESCHNSPSADFKEKIKDWIPADEYMILASQKKSDIRDGLKIVIDICQEKSESGKMIKTILISALPSLIFGIAFHSLLYGFIYGVFVRVSESDTWETMTSAERVYTIYQWIDANWGLLIVGIVGFVFALSWSVKKWDTRGMHLREHYIDYLPPYSLAKLTAQYNISSLTYNYLRCGLSDYDAMVEMQKGCTNYAAYQVDKMINQVNKKTTDSFFNTFMGEFGCDISERGQYVGLEEALGGLIEKMKEKRDAKFKRIISITLMLTLKPLIFISLGMSVYPLIMTVAAMIPDTPY
jgi:type II secretory pathway component PulF